MNLLDKIILFLSAIIYHYRKKLFKNSQKKITLRVYAEKDTGNRQNISYSQVVKDKMH